MNTRLPEVYPDIHLALVSAQAVPNITPLLDPVFRPKEVVLLVTQAMQQQADWLKAVIQPTGVKVTTWDIKNPWDIRHVQDRVVDLLIERDGENIALNATGGTKPMSMAAYEAFRSEDKPVFYVHPEQDLVVWLSPAAWPKHELAHRMKLEAFLGAYGARCVSLERSGIDMDFRELTDELVQDISTYAEPLKGLNWYAHQAEKSLSVALDKKVWSEVEYLAERFECYSLLTLKTDRIIFPDEKARFFVNGGWFEEYVYSQLFNLRKDIESINDLARNIQVVRTTQKGDVRNEIDVAFLANNRLYLIECKTRGWNDEAGNESLYKLDTLKDLLGGLQAQAMLVSYQKLGRHIKRRADDLGIKYCDGADIHRLREKLKEWVK